MIHSTWTYQPSGLGLRQDEFSIQGSLRKDPIFYLRRDRSAPWVLTDLNFGALGDDEASGLLAEFLSRSGGLLFPKIVIAGFACQGDMQGIIAARYNRIVASFENAVSGMEREIQKVELDHKSRRLSVIFRMHPA